MISATSSLLADVMIGSRLDIRLVCTKSCRRCRSFWVTIARGWSPTWQVEMTWLTGTKVVRAFCAAEPSSQRSDVHRRLRSRTDPAQGPLSVPNLLALLREAGGPSLQALERTLHPVPSEEERDDLPSNQCLISNQRIRTIPADNTTTDNTPASATSDITVATRMSAR
jgi:hypothetical protein